MGVRVVEPKRAKRGTQVGWLPVRGKVPPDVRKAFDRARLQKRMNEAQAVLAAVELFVKRAA